MFIRTFRMKVKPEAYPWLNAAAIEVNQVWNWANETSFLAATRTDTKRKWMSGFDLCKLSTGATKFFEKIGADTIQSILEKVGIDLGLKYTATTSDGEKLEAG